MILPWMAVITGLLVLMWSADRFVFGASATARLLGMPPLLIGIIIVGFGTSAPEMVVSAIASAHGNPGIAMGNAYGSNIANIGLILGLTAIISPIVVDSRVLKQELPILTLMTALSVFLIMDGSMGHMDAIILLLIFTVFIVWSVATGRTRASDPLAGQVENQSKNRKHTLGASLGNLITGLVLLIVSSRSLVWGATEIARALGVSDLLIGLTIIALGTSLPELASTIAAVKRGENDIAMGNVIGSNLFNTMVVIGIAGSIKAIDVEKEVLTRDMAMMSGLTLSLFLFGYGFRGRGRINRLEGSLLLTAYILYNLFLISSVIREKVVQT